MNTLPLWAQRALLRWCLFFNKVLGKYGQNAYCRKTDVAAIIYQLGHRYKDNPAAVTRFREAIADVEKLEARP